MGNCGTKPRTKEGPEPVPEPVTQQEVKVEQQEKKAQQNVETKAEETPNASDDKSLRTLLIKKKEEAPKSEEVTAEAEVVKTEPKEEEAQNRRGKD